METAKLAVVVVLPSFGAEEETTIILQPFFITESIMFVLIVLYASSTLNLRPGSIMEFFSRKRDVFSPLLLFFAIAPCLLFLPC